MAKTNFLAKYISDKIRDRKWMRNSLLPTAKQIAANVHCSEKTVRRALGILASQGIIKKTTGGRRYMAAWAADETTGNLAGSPESVETSRENRYSGRIDRLYATVYEDLFAGELAKNKKLPALRELCSRYHCSHVTIRKVLDLLWREGAVLESNGHFVISLRDANTRGVARWVLCIGPAVLTAAPEAVARVQRALVHYCREQRWPEPWMHISDKDKPIHIGNTGDIAGFVFFGDDRRNLWRRFFIDNPSIPLIHIATSELIKTHNMRRSSPSCAFTMDNLSSGRDVGRYLIGKGFRRILFVSHIDIQEPWVKMRFDGLRECLGSTDSDCCKFEKIQIFERIHAENVKALSAMNARARTGNIFPDYVRQFHLSEGWKYNQILNFHEAAGQQLRILAQETNYDAWVCANDDLAAVATIVLRSQNDMHLRPFVVGFDNSYIAQMLNFSSYEFCWERALHTALERVSHSHSSGRTRVFNEKAGGLIADRDFRL